MPSDQSTFTQGNRHTRDKLPLHLLIKSDLHPDDKEDALEELTRRKTAKRTHTNEFHKKQRVARIEERKRQADLARSYYIQHGNDPNKELNLIHYLLMDPLKEGTTDWRVVQDQGIPPGARLVHISPVDPDAMQPDPDGDESLLPQSALSRAMRVLIPHLTEDCDRDDNVWVGAGGLIMAISFFKRHYRFIYKLDRNALQGSGGRFFASFFVRENDAFMEANQLVIGWVRVENGHALLCYFRCPSGEQYPKPDFTIGFRCRGGDPCDLIDMRLVRIGGHRVDIPISDDGTW